ncbi:hypothetical protein [Streptomyces sp. CAU 1734]|uniref:hypothetical protein n=1 Tax=Streptomyces sp. CAU 1734 TaxID=3140360 RepID=UPI003260FD76
MTGLNPTPQTPGIHIASATGSKPARASAVCHCGASATATGPEQVQRLAEGWNTHHGPAHQGAAT